MRKFVFVLRPLCALFLIAHISFLSYSTLVGQCTSGVIEGVVFLDEDLSGIRDAAEIGQSNVIVKAYDADGLLIAQSISNSNGQYSIPGLNDGQDYLVQFEIPNSYYLSSTKPISGSDVQFVKVPQCDVDLGVLDNNSNCTAASEIILSCFANVQGNNPRQQESLIGLSYNFDGSSAVRVYAKDEDTGPVWGLAFNDNNQLIYSASFVKQHTALTAHGHDAIFATSVGLNPQTVLFTKLSDLGQDVGELDYTDPSDCNYGKQVGTIGLGAIAFDGNKEHLYVVNLHNNQLVKIKHNSPVAATTESFTIPNPNCSDADARPFALKYLDDALYVGVTCTAETSLNTDDLSLHIYKFDIVNKTFALEFSTDYARGVWDIERIGLKTNQQWLTDIDFTDDGNMVLGISDRLGHVFCNDASSRVDDQKGDILLVERVNGTWVMESNGSTSRLTGTGVGNGQGPGGGEFFGDDFFPADRIDHPDVTLGSVFVMPGTNEVVATVFDPITNTYSGGVHRYSTVNGSKVAAQELYSNNIFNYFGKATGFGDVVSRCGKLSTEVGNLVWLDDNCDGIQNADEVGLPGVILNVYDNDCTKIGTTVTNAEGRYSFNSDNVDRNLDGEFDGFIGDETYYIGIDPSFYDQPNQSFVIDKVYYSLTSNESNPDLNSDVGAFPTDCSSGAISLLPTIKFSATGGTNASLDLGLKAATDFDLALIKEMVSSPNVKLGEVVTFDIKVFNQGGIIASEYEITDYLTPAFEFDQSINSGWTLSNGVLKKVIDEELRPSQSKIEKLRLKLKSSNDLNDYTNNAEISYAKDHDGNFADDIDSSADDILGNDKGGVVDSSTDDLYSDDGTIDEDDHDPEAVAIFDLALRNVVQDQRRYDVGEVATFEMTVINQGNVAANKFSVTNLFPEELTFEQNLNPSWEEVEDRIVTTTYEEEFLPGERKKFFLKLRINNHFNFQDIIDRAEISMIETANPNITKDIDSDPDAFLFNDNGGDPYNSTDNLVSDSGEIDEDDHDPAILSVRLIDLALTKTNSKIVYNPGDIVEFNISVYNQGETPIGSMVLADYLPQFTTLHDDSWELDPVTNIATKRINFSNGFYPSETHEETILLKVDQDIISGYVINEAEIAMVFDLNGLNVSSNDVDSYPDFLPMNDNGGEFATITDNIITDDGSMDEDDHDPSGFYIADAILTNNCNCLSNATNPFDGQFLDSLIVIAPADQTWYIDQVNNLYSALSPNPPALPIPFNTGPAGDLLTVLETDPITNISKYLLEGVFVENKTFNIRVTNGEGAYLQASNQGYDCSYEKAVIVSSTDGLSAVCSEALHTYGFDAASMCDSYFWTLSGGGVIVGPTNENEVTVQWNAAAGGPYTLTLNPNCADMCLAPVVSEISVGDPGSVMSCNNHINISLNNYCSSQLDADVFLTSQTMPNEAYQLMLIDKFGNIIPNNLLTEEHLWTEVTAKVTNPCNGNSCWATVAVEDKKGPEIQCDDIAIPCYLANTYEPLVLDNCTDATYSLIGETTQPLYCDDDYIKQITRTYIAIDEYGNESEPCNQVINLERIDTSLIVFPPDYFLDMGTNLTCVDSLFDEEGRPLLEVAGVPMLNGYPIFPIQDLYCNVGIEYEDFIVADFGCTRKIMRTWRVYEAWCDNYQAKVHVQTIEIADTDVPVLTCMNDVTVSASGPGCESDVTLLLPEIQDDCSTEFNINISYPGGLLRNVEASQVVTLEAGISTIEYSVYDQCENLATCDVVITVMDLANPVAVCDQNTVVSLRSNGTAKAFADTFDDGSYDDCSLFNTLIKRVDPSCGCDRPEFDDMKFLGERNGRYYYLSNFKTHGSKAFLYSEAYGGLLLTLESEEEFDWVHAQAQIYTTNPYYIGLSDVDHQGRFTWSNHADPVFSRWQGGTPQDVGDNVIVNNDGEWIVVNGNDVEALYILEVSDPCGYSDEVHFCCEDASEEQMVIFRAIDYFGRINECMVTVEVQDKVAPNISCPTDVTITCERNINLDDLSEFGFATATDECGAEITEELIDDRDNCSFGDLIRRFTASDNNGFSTCDQIISIENTTGSDEMFITWPLDFDTDMGCNSGELLPENLEEDFARPRYNETVCNQIVSNYEDQTFEFSGTGSDACLKILRRWTVLDWCRQDEPGYEPYYHDQVIKVNNIVGPEILSGCDTLNINTEECEFEQVAFTAEAQDDCTPGDRLRAKIQIDLNSDGGGDFDIEIDVTNDVITFDGLLPIGNHFALISFSDQCNNITTCTKIINVNNVKNPTAACIDGLSVALEPMDLDGDGTPDTEMACIFPEMVDASSTHVCGLDINLSFSQDTAFDKLAFDCDQLGINTVQLWVTDEFGNTALCETNIEVQDNNMVDFCPRFDLALIKTLDTTATPGPFSAGDEVTFNIEVLNQGNMDAYDIELVDYIPEGLNLVTNSGWTVNNNIATLDNPIEFLADSTSIDVQISFTIANDFMGFTIENVAEISNYDDDNDPSTTPRDDADSTPDDENDDTVGGDDVVDNTNNDEDDHDPAVIEVIQTFNLSLEKDCADSGPYMPGDDITYDLTVNNEGTINAIGVELEDVIPGGLILNDNDWEPFGSGSARLITPFDVNAGQSVTVQITFTIDDMFMGSSILNTAQIIDTDGSLLDDINSTPGNDDGDQSEDDEDAKMIAVGQTFDLALSKILDVNATPGPFETGDDVTFTIIVYNQGSLDATEIVVRDYVPSGFVFAPEKNSDFAFSGGNIQAEIDELDSDANTVLSITLTIADDFTGVSLTNNAEITSGRNALNLDDQDSDLANTNDGTNPELDTDNDIDDERPGTPGTMDNPNDEDDYDPAVIAVSCILPPLCSAIPTLAVNLDANGQATITAADIDNGSQAVCDDGIPLTLSIDVNSFDCTDLGSGNIVTLVATDSNNNVSENVCQTNITVVDPVDPVVLCQDVTTTLDNTTPPKPILTVQTVVISTSDNCSVNESLTTFDITNINLATIACEPQTATVIVTDGSGNTGDCDFEVTIENMPPTAICNDPVSFNLNANGTVTIDADDINNNSTDDCTDDDDLVLSINQSTFDCSNLSNSTTVTLTVTDESGQTDFCSSTVTINDVTNPNAVCQNLTVELDSNGEVTITAMQVDNGSSDECTISGLTLDETDFDCEDVGEVNVVTLTVTDQSGNTDTCEATITVEDNQDPMVTCVPNQTVELDDMGNATITAASSINIDSDNCAIVMREVSPASFDCSDAGNDVTVTVTVTDSSGNTDTCTSTVSIEDNMAPECTLNVTGDIVALDVVDLAELGYSATDNCGVSNITASIDPNPFTCDMLGSQTVTVTVTDDAGNSSLCTATVNVIDDTTPTCEAVDITVNLDNMGSRIITPSRIDNGSSAGCDTDPMLTLDIDTFDCDDVNAPVVVTLTVTGANNMSASCTSNVTVNDVSRPMLQCVVDTMFALDMTSDTEFVLMPSDLILSVSDNCDFTTITDISMFDCDDVGQTFTVTTTATDPSGNSRDCVSNVMIKDETAPTCTLASNLTFPPNVTIDADDLMLSVTENCQISDTLIVPTMFDCDNLGANTVTVTVTDASGNSSECTTSITIEDIPAPVCMVQDITVSLDENGNYFLTADEINNGSFGGCADTTMMISPTFLACNDIPTVNAILTVTDANGATCTASAQITIIDDIDPVITCPMDNIILDLDADGVLDDILPSDLMVSATDGCDIDTITLDITTFDCDDKAMPVTVTATATDNNNNTSSCTLVVELEDNMAPECTLMTDLEFPPQVVIDPSDVLATFTDNCASVSAESTLMPNVFSCMQLGTQTVTLTVDDGCGNTSTCQTDIEIVDSSMPTCVPMDITVSLDITGMVSIDPEDVDGGSSAQCGDDLTLSVTPDSFTCLDQGPNNVVLTVSTSGGGSAVCAAEVTVIDDMPPSIVCPADMTVACDSDISNLNVFGFASATDNCTVIVNVTESVVFNLNTCNVGTIVRTFTAVDGNSNSVMCTQNITVSPPANPITENDIVWPTSPFNLTECVVDAFNIDSGFPVVNTTNAQCSNIGITSFDTGNNGDECSNTFIRTWIVVDSCQTAGGSFTFEQTINIDDQVGPDLTGPMDVSIILPPGNTTCDTFLMLPATATDCNSNFTIVNDSPFADNNATGDASGTYPVGNTTINVTATDNCGNPTVYTYMVSIIDTTAMITDCAKIIDNIGMNQTVDIDISAAAVQITSASNCTTIDDYDLSFSSTQNNVTTLTADCSFTTQLQNYTVYLWSGNMVIDSCVNLLQIVDPNGFCTTPTAGIVNGEIYTEDKLMVDNVIVELLGSPFESSVTGNDGQYTFPSMEFGGSYMIKPSKDINHMNGVSTLDLIAIQKHVIGIETLDSPYKMIAADIDNSGDINVLDILELRKLILGHYESFPDNTSWRLIDSNYDFILPTNPFVYELDEDYEIFEFNSNMTVDFVGVKVGDVNNSVEFGNKFNRNVASESFVYKIDDKQHRQGSTVEINFSSDQLEVMDGIQHTLFVNPAFAEVVGIKSALSDLGEENIRIDQNNSGIVNLSWHKTMPVKEGATEMFALIVNIKDDAYVSEFIQLIEKQLSNEAYVSNDMLKVEIDYQTQVSDNRSMELYQNSPNPWTESTNVKFYMPTEGTVQLNVFDINGKLVSAKSIKAFEGLNSVDLNSEELEVSGVLYYELISGQQKLMNKMLLLK